MHFLLLQRKFIVEHYLPVRDCGVDCGHLNRPIAHFSPYWSILFSQSKHKFEIFSRMSSSDNSTDADITEVFAALLLDLCINLLNWVNCDVKIKIYSVMFKFCK